MANKNEKGQVLMTFVLAMSVLMGFAGLAIDMGVLRYEKRLQETAADAAAIAAASNLAFGGITSAAQNASSANGFSDNGGGQVSNCTTSGAAVNTVCVQVNNPPASGAHAGNAAYVEVLVASVQPTYFMSILGVNKATVTARAVGANVGTGPGSGCLYALDPDSAGIEGVNINGNATLNASQCGIVDNGDFNTSGNALTVNAGTFSVSGTWPELGSGNVTCTYSSVCPALGTPAGGDPLAYLTPPPVGTPVSFNPSNIQPGTYNGISLSGNGTYTFPAGTYVLDGGSFTCSGTPTIRGTNVMFYFTNGATFDCTGNVNAQLSAANSGPYTGILFYQDPKDTNGPSLGGDSSSFYQGALYFPTSMITWFGNGSLNTGANYTLVVAAAVALSGHPTVTINSNYSSLPGGVNIIKNATLVE